MTDPMFLREFTLTHDPETRDITVTMLVHHADGDRRYEVSGTYDPELGGSGPSFEIEERTALNPFPLLDPYRRIAVGPSRHRISLDLTIDTSGSAVTVVPPRGEPTDVP